MTESPSALLERAAATLELRAAKATEGPWTASIPPDTSNRPAAVRGRIPGMTHTKRAVAETARDEDALWIATAHPGWASPLVEWLRDAARRMESHPHLSPEGSTMQRAALAFARIVLGEPE